MTSGSKSKVLSGVKVGDELVSYASSRIVHPLSLLVVTAVSNVSVTLKCATTGKLEKAFIKTGFMISDEIPQRSVRFATADDYLAMRTEEAIMRIRNFTSRDDLVRAIAQLERIVEIIDDFEKPKE